MIIIFIEYKVYKYHYETAKTSFRQTNGAGKQMVNATESSNTRAGSHAYSSVWLMNGITVYAPPNVNSPERRPITSNVPPLRSFNPDADSTDSDGKWYKPTYSPKHSTHRHPKKTDDIQRRRSNRTLNVPHTPSTMKKLMFKTLCKAPMPPIKNMRLEKVFVLESINA